LGMRDSFAAVFDYRGGLAGCPRESVAGGRGLCLIISGCPDMSSKEKENLRGRWRPAGCRAGGDVQKNFQKGLAF